MDRHFFVYLVFPFTENHTNTVKVLVLAGASLETHNDNNIQPIGLSNYNKESWDVLNDAR